MQNDRVMSALIAQCREIDSVPPPPYVYSICTLVNNRDEYQEFLASFTAGGFSFGDCEYLYADNSERNKYDAYAAYNAFLLAANGEYIVLCHQDILLLQDGRCELDRIIADMNRHDLNWAILANAGGLANGDLRLRISDRYGENQTYGPFPALAQSVDENFIVVRRSANLALSHDVSGFHFYGTDLSLIASMLGYNAYVVDFHLRHKGSGRKNQAFFANRLEMAAKYARTLRPRWVRTTCAHVYVSGHAGISAMLNSRLANKFVLRFPKTIRAITKLFGLS